MKNLKSLFAIPAFLLISNFSFAQNKALLQIETNKILCLFSFVETASGARSVSVSFKNFIHENLGKNEKFQALLKRYRKLYFDDRIKKDGYPENRHNSVYVKDLLWIASSNSLTINEFSNRITGYLSNNEHVELIDILKKIEPYYDDLVWNKTQNEIKRIENQLRPFGKKIEKLFLQISNFYGSNWNPEIPFKVMLYPIPLDRGMTTAIPKGNALICGFLSKREDDYKGTLGVIIHEMCHILFSNQSLDLQNKIDNWFKESTSEFNTLAYSYIDEGLATAIGNGWAYQQIHGKIDTSNWYADFYIDGFAHHIFDLVSDYFSKEKAMDKNFVENAIVLFGKKFPKSIHETAILMNDIIIFANTEKKEEIDQFFGELQKHFQIRSARLSTPISDPKSVEKFYQKQKTKLFIIDSNNAFTINFIKEKFKDLKTKLPKDSNFIFCFEDKANKSTIILLHPRDIGNLEKGIEILGEMKFVEYEKVLKF